VNETQVAWVEALQLHSRATPMDREPVPPAEPNDDAELVTLGWHRSVDGLVTLV
jgi:hypothetical protein